MCVWPAFRLFDRGVLLSFAFRFAHLYKLNELFIENTKEATREANWRRNNDVKFTIESVLHNTNAFVRTHSRSHTHAYRVWQVMKVWAFWMSGYMFHRVSAVWPSEFNWLFLFSINHRQFECAIRHSMPINWQRRDLKTAKITIVF